MTGPHDKNRNDDFDGLFKEHFKPLCAFCQYKFDLDLDAAKDVVHSAFIKILEADLTFPSTQSSKAYLYRTAINICLDLKRHEKVKQIQAEFVKKHVTETSVAEENIPLELKELQNDINKAIAELPDQMRKIFELSRNERLKYGEIARQLEISVKTVEIQMSRALAKLRQKLGSYLSMYLLFLMIYR